MDAERPRVRITVAANHEPPADQRRHRGTLVDAVRVMPRPRLSSEPPRSRSSPLRRHLGAPICTSPITTALGFGMTRTKRAIRTAAGAALIAGGTVLLVLP